MGNQSSQILGNTLATCGCQNLVGFEMSAEAVIRTGHIEPWPAKALIRERLENQALLARSSPLRNIPVQDGFEHVSRHIGRFGGLTKQDFLKVVENLVEVRRIPHKPNELQSIGEVFDSMDYDGNEELTVGEWAGGLTVFFKGTQEEKTAALFQLLDRDANGSLSKPEMKEYVTPLVKAMTPPEASALRPLLITHATDTIFDQVDVNHDGKCETHEFNAWRKNHSLVDELVNVIEGEVYKIWLENNMKSPASKPGQELGYSHETRNSIFG
jgi:Ca2+-binding EF-hand superfamily protein